MLRARSHPKGEMSAEEIIGRIRHLEDLESLRALKARYVALVDIAPGIDTTVTRAAIAEVFAQDAEFHVPRTQPPSVIRGLDELFEFFTGFRRSLPFAIHLLANPVITVTGDQASGQWPVLVPGSSADGTSRLFSAFYRERYLRTPAGWRIAYSEQLAHLDVALPFRWSLED